MKTVRLSSKEKDKITLVRIKDKKIKTIAINTQLLIAYYRWDDKSFKINSNIHKPISLQVYNEIKKTYFKKIVL